MHIFGLALKLFSLYRTCFINPDRGLQNLDLKIHWVKKQTKGTFCIIEFQVNPRMTKELMELVYFIWLKTYKWNEIKK